MKILRRLDQIRVTARKVDCDQRMKLALKSKVNPSCENLFFFGDSVFFKLDSSTKWKSGTVLGQDRKILFIKYGNFIRRVPIDVVVPADKRYDTSDVEVDEKDIENDDRLEDDQFAEVEVISKKDNEIQDLKEKNVEKDKVIERLEKEANSKVAPVRFPNLYQHIVFRKAGSSESDSRGKVVHRYKKQSKSASRNIVTIQTEDGNLEYIDFANDVVQWKDAKEVPKEVKEPCCLLTFSDTPDTFHETFHAKVITSTEAKKRPETSKAMTDEIKKFEQFGAFERVENVGQKAIKTRWVFSEDLEQTKGCKIKARLCMRGDRELDKDSIRADSPTAHKDSLKLMLAVAANEKFDLSSGDIKSAFLQGKNLNREVFVVPPTEANEEGVLWLLKKGAYGLIDASRMFYLELKQRLEELGMKMVSGDPAMFTMHKDNKLIGLICVHVDDLLMAGNDDFKHIVKTQLMLKFKFSKVEMEKFKYLGCEITQLKNGDIALNQDEYIQSISDVNLPEGWKNLPPGGKSLTIGEQERKVIRKVVGELLWVSLMTRPDLSFDVNQLSVNIANATLKDLIEAKRMVVKAKCNPVTLNFTHIGPRSDLKLTLFTDASFNNQDGKLRSTEGRVLLLESIKSNKSNLFSWKTRKISRICRSVKAAETRSLEDGLDEAVHFARMVAEIYDGKVNLKHPAQIPVFAKTDNKGLWENMNNSRPCDEKLLRNSIALIKEMLTRGEVCKVDWVPTGDMLADIMTKKGGDGSWIKDVLSGNKV